MENQAFFAKVMTVVGLSGQMLFFLQAYDICVACTSAGVSLRAFLVSFIAQVCWFSYGVMIKDKPLIICNAFGAVGAALVLASIMAYK